MIYILHQCYLLFIYFWHQSLLSGFELPTNNETSLQTRPTRESLISSIPRYVKMPLLSEVLMSSNPGITLFYNMTIP